MARDESSEAASAAAPWRAPRWVMPLFGLASLVLVPWVFLLVAELPSAQEAAHWDIAWGGFDVALALLLLAVAVAAWRRSAWFEGAATATATLLFVDAWFDLLTASTRTQLLVAALEAALVELPLALLCLLLARRAERAIRPRPAPVPLRLILPSERGAEPSVGAEQLSA